MISIGYWKSLKASPNFQGRTMKECLNVLHKDIVTIWNFDDQEDVRASCPCPASVN